MESSGADHFFNPRREVQFVGGSGRQHQNPAALQVVAENSMAFRPRIRFVKSGAKPGVEVSPAAHIAVLPVLAWRRVLAPPPWEPVAGWRLLLEGLERIREVVPGDLNATPEIVPFLAICGLVCIELGLDHGVLVLDVIDASAIVNRGLGARFVGLGYQPIELGAQLSESCFDPSYLLSYCFHGILLFVVTSFGPIGLALF
jgi:hypothetical protein